MAQLERKERPKERESVCVCVRERERERGGTDYREKQTQGAVRRQRAGMPRGKNLPPAHDCQRHYAVECGTCKKFDLGLMIKVLDTIGVVPSLRSNGYVIA